MRTHAPCGHWHRAPNAPYPPHVDTRTSAPWHFHGQPAARSEALAPLEALAKDSRAKEHDAVKAWGSMPLTAIGNTPPTPHTRLTSTRAPQPHGTPQGQPATRSKALAPPEALAKDTRAKEHDAVKARGPMPPAAIGTTPPTHHTRVTSTRAPRPHGTPQGQPAARSEALAPHEALAKDTRAKNMRSPRATSSPI